MFVLRRIYCRVFQLAFRAALPVLPYRNPKIIPSDAGIPDVLRKHGVGSVMIVTDAGIRSLGLTAFLEKTLKENDISYCIYDRTVANPTIWNVEEAKDLYLKEGAQAIIAFGGGSSMDCAKAAGARIVKPHQSISQMKGLLKVHKKLPLLIAIPTTAGTGSETTLAAVITDSEKHYKYPINDFSLIPRYAVLDYHETVGLPKMITATTGMDALTHAMEAFLNLFASRSVQNASIEAVCENFHALPEAWRDGSRLAARQEMLHASYLAGFAFTNNFVGYVHAIAHAVGALYHIPHGRANAVLLPAVLREYGSCIAPKLAVLADALSLGGDTVSEKAERMIAAIEAMRDSFDIPSTLPHLSPNDYTEIARRALKEANPTYPVPQIWDSEKIFSVLRRVQS